MKTKALKLTIDALKGLLAIITTAIVTALIGGQPLTGLLQFKGILTLVRSPIPAWIFGLVLMLALSSLYYSVTHRPKRKGKVIFIPDAYNCGWSKQTEEIMNLRLGGTFSYKGQGNVHILKMFLKGTKPLDDLLLQIEDRRVDNNMIQTDQLSLSETTSEKAFTDFRLTPALGEPGKPLRAKLIVHDRFAEDFVVGEFEFRYIGPPIRQ
ncbi:MAG: hypothetical protein WAN70_12660 [Terriglobales bacterium]